MIVSYRMVSYLTVPYRIISYGIISNGFILYRIVSYRIVLYRTILYCSVLYCILSNHIVSYHIILYHAMLYCIVSYGTILYHIMPYCIVLYCIVSYRSKLYHIVSYHIISYYIYILTAICILNYLPLLYISLTPSFYELGKSIPSSWHRVKKRIIPHRTANGPSAESFIYDWNASIWVDWKLHQQVKVHVPSRLIYLTQFFSNVFVFECSVRWCRCKRQK